MDGFLALVHGGDRDRLRGSLDAVIAHRGSPEIRFRARWPDGSDH